MLTPERHASGLPALVRRAMRRVLPLVLFAAVAVNLVGMDRRIPRSGQPILIQTGGQLSDAVRASGASVQQRFSMYVDLAEIAAGAVLVVPPTELLDPHLVRSLSLMTPEARDYDPKVDLDAFDLPERPMGLVRTTEGTLDYWIVAGADADVWWLARGDGWIVAVPASLVAVPEAQG